MTDTLSRDGGPIRVFLLDDHEIVRRGLKELLEAEPDIEVVGESGLAEEAARRIPALRPDVAILDGRLPDGSGIDVCREIRSRDPEIKALILTSYDDDDALFAARDRGRHRAKGRGQLPDLVARADLDVADLAAFQRVGGDDELAQRSHDGEASDDQEQQREPRRDRP